MTETQSNMIERDREREREMKGRGIERERVKGKRLPIRKKLPFHIYYIYMLQRE